MGEPKFGEPVTVAGMAQTAVTYRIGKAREQDQARTRLNRWAACVNALSGVERPEMLPALLRAAGETVERHALEKCDDPRMCGRPCICHLCVAHRALFRKEEPK